MDGGTNAGVIIAHATNSNGIDFASSEHATLSFRPKLTITYLPPDPPGGSCNPPGTALDFDGVDDRVTMGQAPSLGLSQMTLEAWIKRTGTGQSTSSGSGGVTAIPLIAKGRGEADGDTRDCNYFFGIRSTDGVLAADFEDMATGGNHPVVGTTPVSSDVWHHVAVTYDGTTWRLYLDGQLDATLAANATPRFDSIQHFGLGTAMNSTGVAAGFFDGVIDEARVWNHARSARPDPGRHDDADRVGVRIGRALGARRGYRHGGNQQRGQRERPDHRRDLRHSGQPLRPRDPTRAFAGCTGQRRHQRRQASLAQRERDGPRLGDAQPAFLRADRTCRPRISRSSSCRTRSSTPRASRRSYTAQTQWIMNNRDALNIQYVAHVGDIVNVASQIYQWDNADAAMSILETPLTNFPDGLPYCPSVGNHDIQSGGITTNFNTYFGVSRFQGRGYYGGHFGSDNDNHFNLFSAGGMDFIVISLEYDTTPDQAVLDWADGLLKAHPNRRAIVASHYIVGTGNPASFGTQGQAIYDNLKDNPNLFLLLCGHICEEGQRSDVFDGQDRSLDPDRLPVPHERRQRLAPNHDVLARQRHHHLQDLLRRP